MSKLQSYLSADRFPSWFPLHHFNEPKYNYATGLDLVDFKKPSLWAFVGMVAFNPIFWNAVARNEYRHKTITKIVKSPYVGCYILALTIFSLSGFRDTLFIDAVKKQPSMALLNNPVVKAVAAALFGAGQIFVLSSMWALGVTGTYLGDYFGILMKARVTGFPFNVLNDPMYIGSFLSHLGTALWFQSPVGILLSFWVLFVYLQALRYEGPFTDKIYSAAHKKASEATTADTPRKSSRIAKRQSLGASVHSGSEEETYAQAAAQPRGPGGLPNATPRKSKRLSSVKAEETGAASPMRMTRSRSKGRSLGSDVDTD